MNITAKQYAAGLYASVKGAGETEVKNMISRLAGIMAQKNDLDLALAVEEEFTRLWLEEAGEAVVRISSSRQLDGDSKKRIRDFIKKKFLVGKVKIEQEIDEKIIGGVVIRYKDIILDGCLKTMLNDLKLELIK